VLSCKCESLPADVINKYKVNVMFVGHQHSYERSCPVYKSQCIPSGEATVHIVVGSAGANLERGGFSPKLGKWSAAHTDSWGYCRVTADAHTFNIEFVLNDSGTVWDSISLVPWQ
jgi:acid phosphatase type 7